MSSNISDHFIKPRSGSQKRLNGFPFDESKRNSRSSKSTMSSTRDCLFCGKSFRQGPQRQQFTALVNRALYAKYSSSQNYYYTKDVNDFLSEARTPAVITLKDYIHLDEEEEYLKRFYYANEYDFKIKMLTEYYKFHNDIPRMFIMPVTHVVNRYHDKKRRLEYIRVTKMLKEEQDMQSPETKQKGDEKPNRAIDYTITDRILDDLNFTATEPSELRRDSSPMKTDHPYFGKSSAQGGKGQQKKTVAGKNNVVNKHNPVSKGLSKQQELNQSKDMSISNTIQDLNIKLGEIISNSRSHHFDINYLENSTSQASATMSNLDDFLMFFDKNKKNMRGPGISTADVKPIAKTLTSVPLTERLSRPETPFSIAQAKQAMKKDMMVRASDSIKLVSPRSNRTASKTTKNAEKSKEKQEITRPASGTIQLEKPKGAALITKIKNFEEALKPTPHMAPFHQKSATLTSLPRDFQRDHLQDKTAASTNVSKNTSRVTSSKTPRRQPGEKVEKGEKSQESSLLSKQRIQLYSSASSRPQSTSRTKTKSSENTKNLDLVIGNEQILLAANNTSKSRREIATQSQSHRSTKNAFTFKVKTPSDNNFSQQEKSMGKENIRIDSATTKVSLSRLAFENLGMQTEREMKKIGAFGNLDLLRKDFGQAPLSERQLSKESLHKSKEFYKKPTKGVRATALISTEPENIRLDPPAPVPVEHKKLGMHKYTKSECRIKKPEVEKIDIINNVRTLLADGGVKPSISSPRRQNYVYSSNSNLASAFSNSGTSKKYERPTALKSDRQHYQDALLLQNEGDNFAKMLRSKSPKYEAMAKSTQNLTKKSNAIVHGIDYKQQDFSPLRSNRKEGLLTSHTRVLSERSPPNFSVAFPH